MATKKQKKEPRKAGARTGGAPSIRALARALDVDPKTVRRWKQREDWPFGDRPPWTIDEIEIWREETLESRDDSPELQKAKIELIGERIKYQRQRRRKEAGELIDAEEAMQTWLADVHRMKSALLAMPSALAGRLAGKKPAEIRGILDEHIREALTALAENTK